MSVCEYVSICVHVYVCVCKCVYIYIYIYIYITLISLHIQGGNTCGSFHKAILATVDLSYLRLILRLPTLIL